jgi:thymidylate synthase
MTNNEEIQYLELLRTIMNDGSIEQTRNGKCKMIFGHNFRFSLKGGILPLITTRKIYWKTAFHELMFFIRGQTHTRELHKNNVHIWDANTTRDFLDSNGLSHYEEGYLGPIYGSQWRNYNNDGIDQLTDIISILKDPTRRTSRRLIMTAWNPSKLKEMVLPPCHTLCQFNVKEGGFLSCALYQRSMDTAVGCPTNIVSYSLLTHLLAHHCDLIADEFIHFIGNAHIYEEHFNGVEEQLTRTPFEFPRIRINKKRDNIEDYEIGDIEFIHEYTHQSPIKFSMIP